MSLNRAYILLAAFYSLLLLIGVIALLAGGGSPVAPFHLAVGALAVAGLWGYILKRQVMTPQTWRPLAGLLGVGALVQLYLLLTQSLSGATTTWMLTSVVFSALLVVILYRYGNRDQELWATPEEREGARQLEALLSERGSLLAERREEDRHASVRVTKAGDTYLASVTRRREGQEERFEERFVSPSTLVFFLEKFAGVSIGDFGQPGTGEAVA